MPIVLLQGHCVIVSPHLRQAVGFLDPRVMDDFEPAAADFIKHSLVPGSVNTDEVDVTPVIHNLYELFAGSFITSALNRRISEHERMEQLSSLTRRMMFSSFINPTDGVYTIVLDIGFAKRFVEDNRTALNFSLLKYIHELSLNSVN